MTQFEEWLKQFAADPNTELVLAVIALPIGALLSYWIARKIVTRVIIGAIRRSRNSWDDQLAERGVFRALALFAPIVVLSYGMGFYPQLAPFAEPVLYAALALVFIVLAGRLMSAFVDIYETWPGAKNRPIKGYVQLAKLILYLVGGIFVVSSIIGVSPWAAISGIGAMTAVVLLIFRDTLLSLVAGVQIAAYDLIHQGDWIEVPGFGADGEVIDIHLHTIEVQNWDMTVVTVPTYKLIDGGFKNWRGMTQSGGRRIKRSLLIDQSSVSFCDSEMLNRFMAIDRIKPYLEGKLSESDERFPVHGEDPATPLNRRRLTNLGTFRAYVEAYLSEDQRIRKNMTFLVRQLAPSANGLPIEIYVFSDGTDWNFYENIQADLFDHLLSVLPYFGLRIFQSPTGADLRAFSASTSTRET